MQCSQYAVREEEPPERLGKMQSSQFAVRRGVAAGAVAAAPQNGGRRDRHAAGRRKSSAKI